MAASRRVNAPVTTSSQMVDPGRVAALVRQKPRIILGSSSSARKQLFTELAEHYGFTYEVKVAGIDEKVRSDRIRGRRSGAACVRRCPARPLVHLLTCPLVTTRCELFSLVYTL